MQDGSGPAELLAVFCADVAQAGLHRAYHNRPWLWRFHAVHHSSRHMDSLAGSASRPLAGAWAPERSERRS